MDLPQAVLEWDRGALEVACDRAASVQAGVETYLGRRAFSADGQLIVHVALSRIDDGGRTRVIASVTQRDQSGQLAGERVVTGESECESLDEPLTLVLALMVDAPARAAEPVLSPAPPEPPALTPPRSAPETESTLADSSGAIETAPGLAHLESAPAHGAVLALGAVSMGGLPAAAAGGRLLVTFKPRRFLGLAVDAMAFAPQTKALGTGALELSLLTLSGGICPLQGLDGSLWYSACASFGVARLQSKSEGLIGGHSQAQWFLLPGFGARAAWVGGDRWMVAGGLDGAFPLSADRYVYRDPSGAELPAHEVGALAVTASVGLGLLVK